MKKEEIIDKLKKSIELEVVSEHVREIIRRTVLNIQFELIDNKRSRCEINLNSRHVYLQVYALSDKSVPFEITFSEMIDFYIGKASIFEMEEVGKEIESICNTINMWLASDIVEIQYKRGDYLGRTDYFCSHKYMSSRRLFTRTTPFGRFGKKVVNNRYRPWVTL